MKISSGRFILGHPVFTEVYPLRAKIVTELARALLAEILTHYLHKSIFFLLSPFSYP